VSLTNTSNMQTREEKKEYNRKWREANREYANLHNEQYRKDNKEKLAALNKSNYESKKDGLFTVYLLPKENYVGQTTSLYSRTINHKRIGRDVSDVQIIGKYKTIEEAKTVESYYHQMGYKGKHPGCKGNKIKTPR